MDKIFENAKTDNGDTAIELSISFSGGTDSTIMTKGSPLSEIVYNLRRLALRLELRNSEE